LHAYNLLTNEAAVKDMTGSASTDATTLAKYLGAAILIPLAAYNIISSYVPHAVQRRFGIVNLLSALYCTVVWWYTMNHETQMFKVPILGWLILAALSAYAVFHDGNLSLPQLTFTKSPVSYFALVGAVVSIVFGFQLVLGDGRQFWSDLGLKHDGAVAQLSRFWGLFLQPRLAVAWLTTTTLPQQSDSVWLARGGLVGDLPRRCVRTLRSLGADVLRQRAHLHADVARRLGGHIPPTAWCHACPRQGGNGRRR